jgi:hypothetical protein
VKEIVLSDAPIPPTLFALDQAQLSLLSCYGSPVS